MAEPRLPLARFSDPELAQALTDLGRSIAYPVTPDLASGVRARLETQTSPRRAASPWWRDAGDAGVAPAGRLGVSASRRLALAAACLLIAIVAGLALLPEARTAIADRLGLRGVVIRWIDEAPTPEPPPIGAPLMLGRPVTLEEAQAEVDFPVHVPTAPGFTAPGEVYLSGQGDEAMISFVYPAAPDVPASDATGIGALLTQFQGEPERGLIEKGLSAPDDGSEAETRLEPVTVHGEPGFWISGAPHAVFFVCYDAGECREERYRLAGDVLVWEQDGLTLRLESALPQDEALAVAASVRALE